MEAKPLNIYYNGINRDSVIYIYSPLHYNLKSKLPDKLSVGFSITPLNELCLHGEVKETFFSNTHPNLKNQTEFALNVSYLLSDSFKITGGLFYTGRSYKDDFFNVNDDADGIFLLCGLIAKFDFINLDASIADGHLFSGNWRKQTVLRIGTDVRF